MATASTRKIWQYTISLIDATYKTTKYDLALFFICVKTNVGYSVVAEFVIQSETAENKNHTPCSALPAAKVKGKKRASSSFRNRVGARADHLRKV